MMSIRSKFLWWQWAKMLSVATVPLILTGSPLCAGIAVHLLLDFALQSGETAMSKATSHRHLLAHSLVVGGWSGGVAGFLRYGIAGFLWGTALGVSTHYLVDRADKFGLPAWPQGIVVDQALHILVLLVISSL